MKQRGIFRPCVTKDGRCEPLKSGFVGHFGQLADREAHDLRIFHAIVANIKLLLSHNSEMPRFFCLSEPSTRGTIVAHPTDQVSSMSHSSPRTQRSAESLPLIIPHSKSSQGPRFSNPYFFSTLRADFLVPSQISHWQVRSGPACLPESLFRRALFCRFLSFRAGSGAGCTRLG